MKEKQLERLKKWQLIEELQKNFVGWNFEYLKDRMAGEPLPWDFDQLVRDHLNATSQLLDMGTGGGERLARYGHRNQLTAVTEGWDKNFRYLEETLAPKGVEVRFVKEDDQLAFADERFDLVTNAHESFSSTEVFRVLKPGGFFLTQQVGDLNGLQLASRLLPGYRHRDFNFHLNVVRSELEKVGFKFHFADEWFPQQVFLDMEALVYYCRTIPWEFPDFEVEKHFSQLLSFEDELTRHGKIMNQQHRFVLIAEK